MLLIVGGETDPNTQRIVDQAHILGIEYFYWNTDDSTCAQIAWDFESPDLDLGDHRIRPTSIFSRWNVFGGEANSNIAVHEMIQAYAFAWPQVKLLNRNSVNDLNNKSFNLRLAREVGFEIPKSMVMSSLSPLKSHPNPGSQIAKPLGGGAHTKNVADLICDDEALGCCPPQFIQERLDGENLRLFSVNGELTCFHLVTSELDYRDDPATDVIQIEVPQSLVDSTRQLVGRKSFDYCALDFRCRDGFKDPIFLEVNSFPMFVRFDDAGKNCIANAILDFLTDQRRSPKSAGASRLAASSTN